MSPRLIATRILRRVENGGSLDAEIHRGIHGTGISPRDRGFVSELCVGVQRWRAKLDYIIGQCIEFSHINRRLIDILRLGAYELSELETPPYAVVDQYVRLVSGKKERGFVNYLLREIARKPISFPDQSDWLSYCKSVAAHPPWMIQRWSSLFSKEAILTLCEWNNSFARKTLRANARKITRAALLKRLEGAGITGAFSRYAPNGIDLEKLRDIRTTPLYTEGLCVIQSEASQLVAHVVAPQGQERILDLCAGIGNKCFHLLASHDLHIHAVDIDAHKIALLRDEAKRLGLKPAAVTVADARAFVTKTPFDIVLIDAPCTGIGTIRANPDIKWHIGPRSFATLAKIQRSILDNGATLVRVGGDVVYSVCSFDPTETVEVIRSFLQDHPNFEEVFEFVEGLPVSPERGMPGYYLYPQLHQMDGFYFARLRRLR